MLRLDELFGSCILFKDKINYKLLGEGEVTPHQDIQSNWSDFADFLFQYRFALMKILLKMVVLKFVLDYQKWSHWDILGATI